jgi:hypothetical protein
MHTIGWGYSYAGLLASGAIAHRHLTPYSVTHIRFDEI